jgi:hypothetical protein
MRIEFDRITSEYAYPLSRAETKRVLDAVFAEHAELRKAVVGIRFGCNQRTTQEATVVVRRGGFDVRVNFCLRDGRTRITNDEREWAVWVKRLGGRISDDGTSVQWTKSTAARYAVFLLCHELAHIVYKNRHGGLNWADVGGSRMEEQFCDEWALAAVARLSWLGAEA